MRGNYIIDKLLRTRWVQHIGFWLISYFILLNVFKGEDQIQVIDVIYTLFFHSTIIAYVYLNLKVFAPNILNRKYTILNVVLSGGSLLVFTQLNIWLFDKILVFPGYYFISYYEFDEIMQFHLAYLIITGLFTVIKELVVTREKMMSLEKEKAASELDALKAQINPHFLFNSLNNIHTMASKSAKKTKELVLNLSDMLRYMLYETKDNFVSLEEELNFIKDYIELQKIRLEDENVVQFEISGNVKQKKIAPLLLLPLIENAFKHGLKGDIENTFVKIEIDISDQISVLIENNRGEGKDLNENKSGIGLKNVQRRLELLYPDKFEFNNTESNTDFKVALILKDIHE